MNECYFGHTNLNKRALDFKPNPGLKQVFPSEFMSQYLTANLLYELTSCLCNNINNS